MWVLFFWTYASLLFRFDFKFMKNAKTNYSNKNQRNLQIAF